MARLSSFLPALLAVSIGTIAMPCWAGASQHEQAKRWLQRMMQASQTLSYKGTFVYIQGQDIEVMHIDHNNQQVQKKQRMIALTGAKREVVVADDNVMCLLPKQQVAFDRSDYQRSPLPISLPHDLDQLAGSYRFKMLGDDRIANLSTRVVAILPRDRQRYGYRLWIEHETSMVLRSALLDSQGKFIAQLLFTNIEFIPDADNSTPVISTTQRSSKQSLSSLTATARYNITTNQAADQSTWLVTQVPPGFHKTLHNFYTGIADDIPSEHMVYSDGLATISVYLEYLGNHPALLEGSAQMGTMHAYGLVQDGFQILTVGDVPAATVRNIATAISETAQ